MASLAWYPYPPARLVLEYSRLATANLIPVGVSNGSLLVPTLTATDLKQDTVALLVEVAF